MDIEINCGEGVTRSDAIDNHARDKLAHFERRFGDDVTRIRVFLKDVNADKGGVDKACNMEARPEGLDPVVVHAQDSDLYRAITEAVGKLERALEHRFGRARADH